MWTSEMAEINTHARIGICIEIVHMKTDINKLRRQSDIIKKLYSFI